MHRTSEKQKRCTFCCLYPSHCKCKVIDSEPEREQPSAEELEQEIQKQTRVTKVRKQRETFQKPLLKLQKFFTDVYECMDSFYENNKKWCHRTSMALWFVLLMLRLFVFSQVIRVTFSHDNPYDHFWENLTDFLSNTGHTLFALNYICHFYRKSTAAHNHF